MPLVPAKCTSCDAPLQVNSEQGLAVCQHCNNEFIVERAIQYFNVTNHNEFNAEHMHVHLAYEVKNPDFEIHAGRLLSYSGQDARVVIPDTVTVIAEFAFHNYVGITSVIMPDTVQTIEANAFRDCKNLRHVTFSNTLKRIDAFAFTCCEALESIELPDSVTFIGEAAFLGCKAITSFPIPAGVKKLMRRTFLNCVKLKSIVLPDEMTIIEDNLFGNCDALEHVQFPAALYTIREHAFSGCISLTGILLPDSTAILEPNAFAKCTTLAVVAMPPDTQFDKTTFYSTPYCDSTDFQRRYQRLMHDERKANGQCVYCGGYVAKGPFGAKCMASGCGQKQPR